LKRVKENLEKELPETELKIETIENNVEEFVEEIKELEELKKSPENEANLS
jgi:chaperonin cofactor prefoldin